jgi:hypothetical protein
MATSDQRQRVSRSPQVSTDATVKLIILQQTVQLLEDRVGLPSQLWDTGEDVFIRVAIAKHGTTMGGEHGES